MSDLHGADDRSSFEPDSEPGQESEDMSFFYNLLQSSPAPGSGAGSRSALHNFRGSASMMVNSGLQLTDPGDGAFGRDKVDGGAFNLGAAGDCDGVTSSMKIRESSYANKGSDGSDTAGNRSSKRSRSAEVHNLSEKRRRSKINEKLKALQNLIPNSNKTDKASMLDEAIEYLKQLQLQVQMLTMRNGLGLHPHYAAPPVQLPVEFNSENAPNTSREADTSVLGFANPRESSQNHSVPPMTDNNNAGFQFGLEPSQMQNNYGLFNHMTAAKVPRV